MHNKCIQISKEGLRLLLTGQTIVVKVGNPNRILEFAVNISSAMRNQIIPTIQHFFLQQKSSTGTNFILFFSFFHI
jgi:hypothetical protein